jgi:signal transduction histidine kinase
VAAGNDPPGNPDEFFSGGAPIGSIASSVLDATRLLVGIRDADGRYVHVNDPMSEFHGLAREAFIGKTPEEIGLPAPSATYASLAARESEPLVVRGATLCDATGRQRRFDIVYQVVPGEDRSDLLVEVATESRDPESPAETGQLEEALEAESRMSAELAREVRQLEAEVRDISHREQARLGRDLHDALAQELTGVALQLKSLEHAIELEVPRLGASVRYVREIVDQCLATTRALAQGLTAVELDRNGLRSALAQLAATSQTIYRIPVTFVADGGDFSPEHGVATDLYRIAQEAISNAARHSGPREITLRLFVDPTRIVVAVEDDGRGMPSPVAASAGMGLKIMRYRARIIGARLEIASREGGGTIVRCTLSHPVERAAEGESR